MWAVDMKMNLLGYEGCLGDGMEIAVHSRYDK